MNWYANSTLHCVIINIPPIFIKESFLECKEWLHIRDVTALVWDFIANMTRGLYLEPICIIEQSICVGRTSLFNK